jgi:virulence-associated protein VapD
MAQFALAFDLDTKKMKKDGLTKSQRTIIYQKEIPKALAECGFTKHTQGSLYMTDPNTEHSSIGALLTLQAKLNAASSNFRKYAHRVHIFIVQDWSDVTGVLTDTKAATPMGKEDYEDDDDE